jgi:hypothetical protein
MEQALDSIRSRAVSSIRSNGYFLIASSVVFAGFAFVSIRDGIWQLGVLLFPFAAVFAVTGIVFLGLAKRKAQSERFAK